MEKDTEKFLIKGLGGRRKLGGTITVGGSKNTILKLLPATLLFTDTVRFENVPDIIDTRRTVELLVSLGAEAERTGPHSYSINTSGVKGMELDPSIAKLIRASIVLVGPMLARFKKISFPHPGGDVIGERPIDLFLESFRKMGAKVKIEKDEYIVEAAKGLHGAEIVFKTMSVTATETLMMAAVLAEGKTVLRNAAIEPEITHLAWFLSTHGAKIEGIGTSTLEIEGGEMLFAGGAVFSVPPDRIEAGSFLILGALAATHLEIAACRPEELHVPIEILRQSGMKIKTTKSSIIVEGSDDVVNSAFRAVGVKTHEYPGFPTDLQALMTVYLTQVSGEALVFETIFENRLNYIEDIVRMGANIIPIDPHRVIVKGPTPLKGRELESPDIRAGLAFLIATIVAKGESVLNNVHHIDRGYESIEKRLKAIGVSIDRVK